MDSRSSLTSTSISARYMEKRTTRKKRIGRNMIDDDLVNFLEMIDPNRIDILMDAPYTYTSQIYLPSGLSTIHEISARLI